MLDQVVLLEQAKALADRPAAAAELLLELLLRLGGVQEEVRVPTLEVVFEAGAPLFPEWDAQIPPPKAGETFRIFVLGGSSSQGFGVERPFSALLQHELAANHPERRFEVVNGGLPAAGSHRVLEALKRALDFDADLVIVYLGHNEFLEEIYFDPRGLAARHARLARVARKSRLVRWVGSLVDPGLDRFKPRLQKHFFGSDDFPLIRSTEQYDVRLRFLEANLIRMVEACEASGADLLLVPALPNLLWPPGSSAHSASYESRSDEWERLYSRAETELRTGRLEEAIRTLLELNAIDDVHAHTRYLLGRTRLRLGLVAAARDDLSSAVDLDRHGDRANSEIVELILEVARRYGGHSLDLRQRFYARLAAELSPPGPDPAGMFLDHCHPSPRGHAAIAEELSRLIAAEILG